MLNLFSVFRTFLVFILLIPSLALAVDTDGDGSDIIEEQLAGTSDHNPSVRPYWWRTFNGDGLYNDILGGSVGGAGDVNGDGYDDLIVGIVGGLHPGRVRVFSGMDGNVLYTFSGDDLFDSFGVSVSGAGDVNGDGYADLIVGASGDDNNGDASGSARVFSGVDGTVLYTFSGDGAVDYFGKSVGGAGDVNGDGYADLIVGAYRDDNNGLDSGSARVFSGVDGSVLYTFYGDSAGDYFGNSVSGANDVNGDGYADLIVGAYKDDNNGSESGSVQVFSGKNGAVLYAFDGDSAADEFGRSVSGAGDVNNDGYADLIVGASGDDNNGNNSGSAYVFSGADGSLLYTFNGEYSNDNLGLSVSGAGDVNGDGYAELIVGTKRNSNNVILSGAALVFNGLDGSLLYRFNGDSYLDSFGVSVSGAGDVNGDGLADLIVGATGDDNGGMDSGSARVFLSSDLLSDVDLDFVLNQADAFPLDASESADSDGDGVGDNGDAFPLDATETVDTDGDGVGDNTDVFPLDASETVDSDGDGVGDNADTFPLDPTRSTDSDSDGVDDNVDNCQLIANVDQLDFDLDELGDACDTDDDNDGSPDSWETIWGSDPFWANVDTDGDGVPNYIELNVYSTDPYNTDTDSDGANDGLEIAVYLTDPLVADLDTDNDGWPNVYEESCLSDPLNNASIPSDNDADFICNRNDPDDDNDGVLDADDAFPYDETETTDTDHDGVGNNADIDDDGDYFLDNVDPFPLDAGKPRYTPLYTLDGQDVGDNFGFVLANVGDMNLDGYADMAIGISSNSPSSPNVGRVRVVSGLDGTSLLNVSIQGEFSLSAGSVSSAGDVNGDGYLDVIVGAPLSDSNGNDSGSVKVFSGLDGAVIYQMEGGAEDKFGFSVAGLGDINTDGYDDFFVGSACASRIDIFCYITFQVFSGLNGNELYGPISGGYSVATMNDVDGDDVPDFVASYRGLGQSTIQIHSSATGEIMSTINPFGDVLVGDTPELGSSLDASVDINGDGYNDVISGGHRNQVFSGGGVDTGHVFVFSGFNSSIVHSFEGGQNYSSGGEQLGHVVKGVKDINADGYDDFVMTAPNASRYFLGTTGLIRLVSGKDGSDILALLGNKSEGFGLSLAVLDDLNGDGKSEFAIGKLVDSNGSFVGAVSVYSLTEDYLDSDADGVRDLLDVFPLNESESSDGDSDGVGDNADQCDATSVLNIDNDADGCDDATEDLDDDNDGVFDTDEIACGSDPLDASSVCNTTPSTGESDFDGDLDDDVLLRSTSSSNWRLFSFASGSVTGNSSYAAYANNGWDFVANLDADGDLDKDMLLRNTSTGAWRLFIAQNGVVAGSSSLALYTPANYSFAAALDVDADGDEDILLRNSSDGKYRLFTLQNGIIADSRPLNIWASSDYDLSVVGDFDGDSDDDVLLRNNVNGSSHLFNLEAGVVVGDSNLNLYADSSYRVQVASDFDGDGDDDILIRNTSTGAWNLFSVQGGAVSTVTGIYPYQSLDWSFQTEGDFDGDGDSDLLLRNSSGIWKLFTVQGGVVTGNSGVSLYSSTDWQLQR
ncbi:MAG: FG-GAP repeat protein [Pseudomonadales bacterium]|nr:FG-GAP repeat protein [Pseudomonadales bacterium]